MIRSWSRVAIKVCDYAAWSTYKESVSFILIANILQKDFA